MSNFITRNILICVVPTVIVLLSVYWFRKKKKFKTSFHSIQDVQTISAEEFESKLDSLAECSSDSADTLSDASSFASPESSEKSLRTKSFPLVNTSNNTVIKNDSICSSMPATPQSNHIEINSCQISPSSNKSESPISNAEDFQSHNALNIIKLADSDSDNNKSEVGNVCNVISSIDKSEMAEKCNLLPALQQTSLDEVAKIEVDGHDLSNGVDAKNSSGFKFIFSGEPEVFNYSEGCMDATEVIPDKVITKKSSGSKFIFSGEPEVFNYSEGCMDATEAIPNKVIAKISAGSKFIFSGEPEVFNYSEECMDVTEVLPNKVTVEDPSGHKLIFSEKPEDLNCNKECIDATEAILKMISFNQGHVHVIENGSLHSIDSNESAVSSQASELEKLQTIDTDSNDSHSSVLDENSLSYISDDSEKQQIELKNKDSLSSALEESFLSSLCDEVEKSNSDSPSAISSRTYTGADFKETGAIVEKKISVVKASSDFAQAPVSKGVTKCIVDSSTLDETLILDSIEDRCSNSVYPADAAQNMLMQLPENSDSIDSDTLQGLSIESNDNLLDPNCSAASQIESFYETLASCDSSLKSSCIPTFNEKSSPKSSIPVPEEILQVSNSLCVLTMDSSPVTDSNEPIQVTDELITGDEPATSAAFDERPEVEEPQITQMDISGHLNMQKASMASGTENSLESSAWEMQESHSEVLSQSKTDETEIDSSKVPENSSGQYVYEFELPQELCGRLIGKHGKHVKSIKDRSHANVYIKRHPYDPQLKIVVVEGNQSDVNDALEIIRRKYPPSRYPTVTLVKTNMISSTNVLPESLQLHIPEGASCDVILSSLVSAGHFFLQQPTHPTYPSLNTLDQCMVTCYSQQDTPLLPHPVEAGVICAAPVLTGWYRAQVIYVYENEIECELKFVDYGGFSQAATSSLRQIRSDFMSLPFQASECYLANVRPVDPVEGWSTEATATFEELAQGQILQALLVEYATDGIPCVHLFRVQGISNMFINKELVERGLAVWVNNSHWDPH